MSTKAYYSRGEIGPGKVGFSKTRSIIEAPFYGNNVIKVNTLKEAYELAKNSPGTVVTDMPVYRGEEFGLEPDAKVLLFNDGSTTILVAVVKGKDVTKESINAAMKAAASESFGYNEDPIVSSDVIGMRYGSLFDATQTMVAKIDDDTYQVQVVSWYDNENSYTSQMVRTIKYFAEL